MGFSFHFVSCFSLESISIGSPRNDLCSFPSKGKRRTALQKIFGPNKIVPYFWLERGV